MLTSTYPVLVNAFARLQAPDFVQRLSSKVAEKHNVTVVAPTPAGRAHRLEAKGLSEVFFPFFLSSRSSIIGEGGILDRLRARKTRIVQVPLLVIAHLISATVEIFNGRGQVILHAHWLIYSGLIGVVLKRLIFWRDIKLVLTIHGSDSFFFRYRGTRSLCKLVLNSSDAVTCVSPLLTDTVKDLFDVDAREMPMGVPDSLFEHSGKYQRSAGRILFVGRVVRAKGINHILPALQLLPPPFHLVIVGGGPYLASFKQKVADMGLSNRVFFRGWLDERGVMEEFLTAVCLVLPSESEGFSVTVLEAMAAKLPIVGNNIPAIKQQLSYGRGYLIDVTNSLEFAKAISLGALIDPEVVERANSYAGQYRWSRVAEGYRRLYEEISS